MALRFGTDGVRGVANVELTPEFVLALGRAVGRVLVGEAVEAAVGPAVEAAVGERAARGGTGAAGAGRGRGETAAGSGLPAPSTTSGRACLVGRDTRRSGPMLAAALAAGLASVGVDAVDLGVIPTPGVAALSAAYGIPGAMISASHNPFYDNGVKVFAAGGRKLSDEVERRLEEALEEALGAAAGATGTTDDDDCAVGDRIGTQLHNGPAAPSRRPHSAGGAGVGTLKSDTDGLAWYRRQVLAALEGRRLDGMRVVLDCGHGAAVVTAPDVAAGAGAEVVEVLGAAPDGVNINAGCGSTAPGPLAAAVVARGADVGLAFDGDADRVIAVDGTGAVVDGDRLLALFATDLAARGALAGGTVAVTVMTNLGFHRAMAGAGIAVHQTDVGDRNVLSALDDGGWSLGGEQSGHLIFRDLATTGDGVLSGLLLLDLVRRAGRPLAELAAEAMERFPQVLLNVAVADPSRLAGMTEVWEEVHAVERHLGERGRVLLRPSGTEPLVRVMVEASTDAEAGAAVARIAGAVQAALGRPAA